jgi:tetratricopeptide (TPR) repeat protein
VLLTKASLTDRNGSLSQQLAGWGDLCIDSLPESKGSVQRAQARLARQAFERALVYSADASEAFRGLGTLDLMERHPARAVEMLGTASQLGSTAMAHYQLGCAHAYNGDRYGALAAWSGAPQVAALFASRGVLHSQDGRLDQALRCYQTAVEIEPTPLVAYRMGDVYRKLGRLDDALAAYQALAKYGMSKVTLFPCVSCTRPALSLAYEGEGQIAAARGDWHKAVLALQEALHFEPANASLLSQVGWAVYKDTQDVRSANEYLLAAAALNPSSPWPQSCLGDMYRAEGQYGRARDFYARALFIDPQYPYAHYGLGQVMRDVGDLANALVELERAVELDPHNDWYRAALCDTYRQLGGMEQAGITCPTEAMRGEPDGN